MQQGIPLQYYANGKEMIEKLQQEEQTNQQKLHKQMQEIKSSSSFNKSKEEKKPKHNVPQDIKDGLKRIEKRYSVYLKAPPAMNYTYYGLTKSRENEKIIDSKMSSLISKRMEKHRIDNDDPNKKRLETYNKPSNTIVIHSVHRDIFTDLLNRLSKFENILSYKHIDSANHEVVFETNKLPQLLLSRGGVKYKSKNFVIFQENGKNDVEYSENNYIDIDNGELDRIWEEAKGKNMFESIGDFFKGIFTK